MVSFMVRELGVVSGEIGGWWWWWWWWVVVVAVVAALKSVKKVWYATLGRVDVCACVVVCGGGGGGGVGAWFVVWVGGEV